MTLAEVVEAMEPTLQAVYRWHQQTPDAQVYADQIMIRTVKGGTRVTIDFTVRNEG